MFLAISQGAEVGRAFELTKRIVRIGRSGEHAEVVLRGDAKVSRRHATVIRLPHPRGAHFVLIDEGSKNGVLVNDRRVEVHCLNPCDQIRIGSTVLDFLPVELLPDEDDKVSLSPLLVESDPDGLVYRRPGEIR